MASASSATERALARARAARRCRAPWPPPRRYCRSRRRAWRRRAGRARRRTRRGVQLGGARQDRMRRRLGDGRDHLGLGRRVAACARRAPRSLSNASAAGASTSEFTIIRGPFRIRAHPSLDPTRGRVFSGIGGWGREREFGLSARSGRGTWGNPADAFCGLARSQETRVADDAIPPFHLVAPRRTALGCIE